MSALFSAQVSKPDQNVRSHDLCFPAWYRDDNRTCMDSHCVPQALQGALVALLLQHWPSCTCQDAQAWIAPACAFLCHLGPVHEALPRRAIPGPQQQPSAA